MKKSENPDCGNDNGDKPEEILPAVMTYLTPDLIEQARTQLNETDETKPKALAELRRLVKAEKNLLSPTDDLFLLSFLRARKFDVKKAFKLVQHFYNFRKANRKVYDMSDLEIVTSIGHRNFFGCLEHRDRNGCVVFIGKAANWEPEIDSFENVMRAFTALLIYSMEHEATQIAGYRAIFDIRGVTWKQLKHFTPSHLLLLIRGTQFSFPGRYKGIHVLSNNRTLRFLWALAHPFLTAKLKKRVFFHGEDLSPLLKYIHPSILPEEYGGQAPPYNNDRWFDLIYAERDKVYAFLQYGYKD